MTDQFNVCAVFGERRRMQSALRFAGELCRDLGANDLHVYLPACPAHAAAPTLVNGSAAQVQAQRVEQSVKQLTSVSNVIVHGDIELDTLASSQLPPNAIIVHPDLALRRSDLTILNPFEETVVRREGGGILVPFGDGDAGVNATIAALPLAKKLAMEIVFYHTTWRAAGIASDNAVDHMCTAAREHYEQLGAMAAAQGVRYRVVVEMADDVVFGMLACALSGDVSPANPRPVSLIVMSPGVNTCLGSYVEKSLARSSTPLLVAAEKRADQGGGS